MRRFDAEDPMIANEQQVPRGKGILQIFAFFLLAMAGGFLVAELSTANMLTSPVRYPSPL